MWAISCPIIPANSRELRLLIDLLHRKVKLPPVPVGKARPIGGDWPERRFYRVEFSDPYVAEHGDNFACYLRW